MNKRQKKTKTVDKELILRVESTHKPMRIVETIHGQRTHNFFEGDNENKDFACLNEEPERRFNFNLFSISFT